jgi:D-3-phosphoglycerate dehydrogenase
METILNLARPTPGDLEFYSRWKSVGHVLEVAEAYDQRDVTVLVTDQRTPIDTEFLAEFPKLKYVCSATTGHTHLRFDPAKWGIKLITLRGEREFLSGITSVSEYVMRMILHVSRPMDGYGHSLRGKRLGIVGLGRIGRQVASFADALGMTWTCYDTRHLPTDLRRLFETSDFVSLHVDENETSRGMITRELIHLMKPTAWLINTARGSVVDEQAVFDACFQRRIAGAVLDVVESEFRPTLPNLIITPHIAGSTIEDRVRTDQFIVEKILKELCQSNPSAAM